MSGMLPKLRFPEFNGEWKTRALNVALKPKKLRNYDNKYTKNDVLSVSGDVGIVNQIQHLGRSYAGVLVDNYHIVEVGDIVYTKSPLKANPYGIIKANKNKNGIVSTLYAVYEVDKNHDYSFWERYFELDDRTNSYLMPLVHIGAKNDMKINNDRVLIDPVTFPALPEQQKIADFLSAIDAKIDAVKRKRDAFERYKKGLMQQIFSQKIRFKQDDGSDFPEWEEKRLGEVARTFSGGTPSVGKLSYYNGAIPFIKSGEISLNKVADTITDYGLQNSSAKIIKKGDLLYALYGANSGEASIAKISGAINQAILCIRSKQNIYYLYSFLSKSKEIIRKTYLQGGQGNLSAEIVKSVMIPLPTFPEQQIIADFFSAIDDKIDAITSQVQKLEAFKKGLLQQMFV